MIGPEAAINYPPTVKAPYPAQTKQMAALSAKLDRLQSQTNGAVSANLDAAQAWPANPMQGDVASGRIAQYILGANPSAVGQGLVTPAMFGPVKSDAGRDTGAIHTDDKSYVELGKVGDFEWNKPARTAPGSSAMAATVRRFH